MGKSTRKPRWSNVECLGDLDHPSQVAIELLKRAEAGEIQSVALVVRTTDGQLEELWSECDMSELSEKAMYLHAAVSQVLLEEHDTLPLVERPEGCEDDS